jgi:hypothetical protein
MRKARENTPSNVNTAEAARLNVVRSGLSFSSLIGLFFLPGRDSSTPA